MQSISDGNTGVGAISDKSVQSREACEAFIPATFRSNGGRSAPPEDLSQRLQVILTIIVGILILPGESRTDRNGALH